MTLTFVRADLYFATYQDRTGYPVYRVNSTYRAPWDLDAALRLRSALELYDLDDLREVLSTLVLTNRHGWSPVDALQECETCSAIGEDHVTVEHGYRVVCESCRDDNYSYCGGCQEYVSETYYVDDLNESYCDNCADNLPWCDECDERVGEYHDCPNANRTCECEAPAQSFTFHGVSNDNRHAVSLPDGVLSDEGREAIRTYLYGAGYASASYAVEDIEPVWMSKRGTFAKRLTSATRERAKRIALPSDDVADLMRQVTPPAEVISEVGNLFRAHSGGSDVTVDLTRDFNRGADYFYHSDSCWFSGGDYGASLCWLKESHGIGLRTVGSGPYDVRGRAWILPVNDERESCPVDDATAYVVFNGYGDLEGYQGARIVAALTGLSYTKIGFSVDGAFINGNAGYLVAAPDVVAQREDIDIREYASC